MCTSGPWKAIRQEVKGRGRFKCREEEKGQRKCWAGVRRQSGRKEGAAEGRAACVERAPRRLVDRHNIRKSKQAFRAQGLFRHIDKAVRREHRGGAWRAAATAIRKAFLSEDLPPWRGQEWHGAGPESTGYLLPIGSGSPPSTHFSSLSLASTCALPAAPIFRVCPLVATGGCVSGPDPCPLQSRGAGARRGHWEDSWKALSHPSCRARSFPPRGPGAHPVTV